MPWLGVVSKGDNVMNNIGQKKNNSKSYVIFDESSGYMFWSSWIKLSSTENERMWTLTLKYLAKMSIFEIYHSYITFLFWMYTFHHYVSSLYLLSISIFTSNNVIFFFVVRSFNFHFSPGTTSYFFSPTILNEEQCHNFFLLLRIFQFSLFTCNNLIIFFSCNS